MDEILSNIFKNNGKLVSTKIPLKIKSDIIVFRKAVYNKCHIF